MSDVIKIISPIEGKNRIQSGVRAPAADAPFDIDAPVAAEAEIEAVEQPKTETPGSRPGVDIAGHNMRPLVEHTKACADGIRTLILYCKLFMNATDVIDEEFLDRLFVMPEGVLEEILRLDEGASAFRGEFFEALRAFATREELKELRAPILSILKHFDCYVQRDSSLDYIRIHISVLADRLERADATGTEQLAEVLDALPNLDAGDFDRTSAFLKEELMPMLHTLSKRYPPNHSLQDAVRLLTHYVVRYDRANPVLLDKAYSDFSQALKLLLPRTEPEEIELLKALLLDSGNEMREQSSSPGRLDDVPALLKRALDKEAPAKINAFARALLVNLVQKENPAQPYLHFLLPLRFHDQDVYAEFYVDKDSEKAAGRSQHPVNIFFTIQSDAYGTFEVDLIASNQAVELAISAPEALERDVHAMQGVMRNIVEAAGWRLTAYRTKPYVESETLLKRFPGLRHRKVGLNVKV